MSKVTKHSNGQPETEKPSGKASDTPSGNLSEAEATLRMTHAKKTVAANLSVSEIGQLGPYKLIRELGAGGMGVVFEAEDMMLTRHVALKVLRHGLTQMENSRERFIREARAMAQLAHDNIVTIFQVGEDRGFTFMAMQLLEGEVLEHRLLREGPLKVNDVIRIGREIAEGLTAAHEKGLIHRDIKPANIWLEKLRERVKLLDFGLARMSEAEPGLTQSGIVLGTPGYMSPEQARGEPLDPRSDLFSLGCVLYQLLTGIRPFDGLTVVTMLREVELHHPPRITAKRPEVSTLVSNLVMELLAKNRKDRPLSAAIVADRLSKLPTSAMPQLLPAIVSPALLAPPPTQPGAENKSQPKPPSGAFRPASPSGAVPMALPASPSGAIPTALPASPSGAIPVVKAPPSGAYAKTSNSGAYRAIGSNPAAPAVQSPAPPSGAQPQQKKAGNSGPMRIAPASGIHRSVSSTATEASSANSHTQHGIGGFLQFGALVVVVALCVWGYYQFTNRGSLIIESDDLAVQVEVRQTGSHCGVVTTQEQVNFQAGDYELVVLNAKNGWVLERSRITIRRGETEKVRIYPHAGVNSDSGTPPKKG